MREIKFRAWNFSVKKMFGVSEITWNKFGVMNIYDDVNLQTDATLMQFTGLKDKNGKEIYEGDILDYGGLKPVEILWKEGRFRTKLIPFENSEPVHLTQEGLSHFAEIIGNIYENPELLK